MVILGKLKISSLSEKAQARLKEIRANNPSTPMMMKKTLGVVWVASSNKSITSDWTFLDAPNYDKALDLFNGGKNIDDLFATKSALKSRLNNNLLALPNQQHIDMVHKNYVG